MDVPFIEIDLATDQRDCIRHALITYARAGHGNPMMRDDWLHTLAAGEIAVGGTMPFGQISMDDDSIARLSARLAPAGPGIASRLEQGDVNTILAALWHASNVEFDGFPAFLTGTIDADLPQQHLFVRIADAAAMRPALAQEFERQHRPKAASAP